MSEGFSNRLIGGGGSLVYPSIHSPNFLAGTSGWTVNKDGSAEFNNIVIRNGQIVSGVDLFYSASPPAANKLVASISATAGTDAFGNAYLEGITEYIADVTWGWIAANHGNGGFSLNTAASQAGPWVQRSFLSIAGTANLVIGAFSPMKVELSSPAGTQVDFFADLRNETAPAAPTSASRLYSSKGTARHVKPSGLDMAIPKTDSDTISHTVTQAVATDISNSWIIPAGDANVGTVYELICQVHGIWGSTQQQLNWQGVFQNVIVSGSLAATAFPVSTVFRGWFKVRAIIQTTGATGSLNAYASLHLVSFGEPVQGAVGTIDAQETLGTAIDTTANHPLSLQMKWAATTGAPTITCSDNTLERAGP